MTKLAHAIYGLCLLLLLTGLQANGQSTVPIRGQLKTDAASYDVDSQLVVVEADTALGPRVDSFYTNANGRFRGPMTVNSGRSGQLTAAVQTCDNRTRTDTAFTVADSIPPDSFILNACPRESLEVQGNLTADDPSYSLNGRPVFISYASPTRTDTVFHDPSSGFRTTLSVPPAFRDTISVTVNTCNGRQVTKTRFVDRSDTSQVSFTLNACPLDTLVVQGQLTSDDPGYDLSGRQVTINEQLSRSGRVEQISTDSAGEFRGTYPVPPSARDSVIVTATTCNGESVQKSRLIRVDSGLSSPFRLNVCPQLSSLQVRGSVGKRQGSARAARVYLYQYQQVPGAGPAMKLVDSTMIDTTDGSYRFENIPPDTYTLRARPLAREAEAYMPTYFRSVSVAAPGAVSWQNADSIALSTRDFSGVLINLHSNRDVDGPGFISGYVFGSGPVHQQVPDSGVMVVLRDQNGDPVAYQRTDSLGFYEFANIPLGRYTVRVEIPGKPSETEAVRLMEEDLSTTGIIFQIKPDEIMVEKRSGQVSVADRQMRLTRLYPNPVQDQLHLVVRPEGGHKLTLSLHTVQGRQVYRNTTSARQQPLHQRIDMSTYPEGVYLVRLSTASTVITQKVIKH